MTTGLDLKVERLKAHLTQRVVANALQTSPQHVSAIEARAFVRPETADRYRAALLDASMTDNGETSAEVAS